MKAWADPAPAEPVAVAGVVARARRAAVAGAALAVAVLAPMVLGACADPYVAPCRVEGETYLVRETALPPGVSGRLLPRVRVSEDGSLEATWLATTSVLRRNLPVETVTRGDALVASADGREVRRFATAAPLALRSRRGSTIPLGTYALAEGLLFPWIEEDVLTAQDGSQQTRSRLRSQIVHFDGSEAPLQSAAAATCENCTFAASFARLSDSAVILVTTRTTEDARGLFYVYLAEDGSWVRTEELLWGKEDPPENSQDAGDTFADSIGRFDRNYTVESVGDGYIVRGFGEARVYSRDFQPRYGARTFEAPDNASVYRTNGRLQVVYPEPVDEQHPLRDDSAVGRGEGRALYFAEYDEKTGARTAAPKRFSVGAVVLGATHLGATLRTSAGLDYFAWLTPSGEKVAADLPLAAVPGTVVSSLSSPPGAASPSMLPRSFVDYRVSAGVVFRRSIVCGN